MTDISLYQAGLATQWWLSLDNFMTQGGPVLWGLALVAGLCWLLVIERVLFLGFTFPSAYQSFVSRWQARACPSSWASSVIRDGWLFEAHNQLFRHLNLIKGLVAICPMLGLLGTVTGMITVFDVIGAEGAGEARTMAEGISMATLPTLAGMVIALAGLFAHARLFKACERREAALAKALRVK
ncbi:MotA/TolQ/ExbB proton channel family protein [Enterovibrio makurazakiensis]|uniref:MotA/TolQ/ExbB proton channel family protein n=1 Tax=Enterovibrio gelatinilyticus TaxID=2899819 RepID=A0ABT5R2J5_9GAMM|nr:MotA/TolQ/ExbB proton channel family protein [Enterovibrio sp. ZSDZ42]MDD1794492.1 MotA/TolQ/ExbB proton channel family protein [Enterovibrio sp. ZSDZ42]